MAKAIAGFEGGVQYRIQVGVREDGAVFRRAQNRGPYGYFWEKWRQVGNVAVEKLDYQIDVLGYSLRQAGPYSNWKGWRLPN